MPGDVALILPAAGLGTRMKAAVRKPFLEIAGKPILALTLERFHGIARIGQIIIAVNGDDLARRQAMLAEWAPLGVTDVVAGGATRTESVRNALAALGGDAKIVLIHDAVRPFVHHGVISAVIDAAGKTGAAIAAVPVKDTIKRVDEGRIVGTVPRLGLYLAQTPQGFRREIIERVYRDLAGADFTDDASLVEASGGEVAIVESTYDNIKITTPEDLELARHLAGRA